MVKMNKKNIPIIIGAVVAIIVIALLILFGIKKEVSFETMSESVVENQKVRLFGKATKPNDPTREGYVFENWYLEDKIFDFNTSITKNIKLVAKWSESGTNTYNITFNTGEGSNISPIKTDKSGRISRPATPTREGYRFVAWQLDGKDFDFNTKITKDVTLVAKWEKDNTTTADTRFKIKSGNITLTVGNTKKLSTLNGSGKVTWSSSNTKVVKVDNNGNIRAVASGTAVITAKSGNETTSVTVTVKAKQITTPTQPTDPTPVEPENPTPQEPEKVTYKPVWTPVKNTTVGEEILTIKGSDGKNYAGKVKLTMISGNVVDYDIPTSGEKFVRAAVKDVTVVSPN